jgi:hypothetical protein
MTKFIYRKICASDITYHQDSIFLVSKTKHVQRRNALLCVNFIHFE